MALGSEHPEHNVTKTAYLFPGQGAQAVGMGHDLYQQSAAAKAVFDEADEALGEKLSATIFDGPADALKLTANTQPAILTASVAVLRALEEAGAPAPAYVAGHSLGEYSALVAAGAIAFADAVRAVRARGTFMQDAVPAGEGAMAAVIGLDADKIASVVSGCSRPDDNAYVAVANYNGPAQTVIAGDAAGVESAVEPLKAAGARMVKMLPVSAPFHCAKMSPVGPKLEAVLADIAVRPLEVPLLANVTAAEVDATDVKRLLVEQVTAPVRFTEIGEGLFARGVDRFVEVGPGKTLIGILKRMDKARTYLAAGNVETVAAAVA